jgi:hypothetical protein
MSWWKWVVLVLLVAAIVYLGIALHSTRNALADLRSHVTTIHDFLGTDRGDDPTRWKGYLGTEKQNRKDLRVWLGNLRCRVEKLETPGGPDSCPQDGPPGTVPKDNGSYPP